MAINIRSTDNTVFNPLTISKPQYIDTDIEEVYIANGEEYIQGKGYIQKYDVVVVRRITPDMVRKYIQSFNDKESALNCMYSYYKDDLVKGLLTVLNNEPSINTLENNDSTVKIENTKSENKTFSFADDDLVNKASRVDTQVKTRSNNLGAYKKQVRKDSSIF